MENKYISNTIKRLKLFVAGILTVPVVSLLPFDDKTVNSLLPHFNKMVILSLCGEGKITRRIRIGHNFLKQLKKFNDAHGPDHTILWLKAMHIALMRYAARDPLSSLREIDPSLPLPRLYHGCPNVINRYDRQHIRKGKVGITRFWLSMFSIYRLFCMERYSHAFMEAIRDSYKGSLPLLLDLISFLQTNDHAFYKRLNGLKRKFDLCPKGPHLSHSASPSCSTSWTGLFGDLWIMERDGASDEAKVIKRNIDNYLATLRKGGVDLMIFDLAFSRFKRLASYIPSERFPFKDSIRRENGLSQFAIKKEAAGKLRIFALIDSWSQTVLKPLHDALFDILRMIPNDGTFNQDAAFRRCQEKATKFGVAYSYDLSSATDRMPSRLTAALIENLMGIPSLGDAWHKLMTERKFHFKFEDCIQLEIAAYKNSKEHPTWYTGASGVTDENTFVYGTGQPMGGLSSWAGLAVTHHWIMQYCSWKLGNFTSWEERYEILGDDIVIFDEALAKAYCKMITSLGMKINMTKSLRSKTAVFEFAKRLSRGLSDLTPVSLKQLVGASSMASRVSDAVRYIRSGIITNVRDFETALLREAKRKFGLSEELMSPTLSVLGLLADKSVIEHRTVLDALVNPTEKNFSWESSSLTIPLRSILKWELDLIRGNPPGFTLNDIESRRASTDKLFPLLIREVLIAAGQKARAFLMDYRKMVHSGCKPWFKDFDTLPQGLRRMAHDLYRSHVVPYYKLNKVWDDLLLSSEQTGHHLEKGRMYSHGHDLKSALALLTEVERVIERFSLFVKPKRKDRDTIKIIDRPTMLLKYARKVLMDVRYKGFTSLNITPWVEPYLSTNSIPDSTHDFVRPPSGHRSQRALENLLSAWDTTKSRIPKEAVSPLVEAPKRKSLAGKVKSTSTLRERTKRKEFLSRLGKLQGRSIALRRRGSL